MGGQGYVYNGAVEPFIQLNPTSAEQKEQSVQEQLAGNTNEPEFQTTKMKG